MAAGWLGQTPHTSWLLWGFCSSYCAGCSTGSIDKVFSCRVVCELHAHKSKGLINVSVGLRKKTHHPLSFPQLPPFFPFFIIPGLVTSHSSSGIWCVFVLLSIIEHYESTELAPSKSLLLSRSKILDIIQLCVSTALLFLSFLSSIVFCQVALVRK